MTVIKQSRMLLLVLLSLAAFAGVILLKGRKQPRAVGGIVSLAPSITEILFELGAGDQITGATDYCDYPAEAKAIPRVGSLGSPNIELLLAMQPRLVLAANFEHKNHPEILRASGIEVIELRIETIEDVFAAVDRLGQITGAGGRATEMNRKLQACLDEAKSLYEGTPLERRPTVYIEIASKPIMTVGRRSFVHDIIELAGGVNVAGGLDALYPVVNPETVVQWNPQVMLVGSMTQQSSEDLGRRIGWGGIDALRNGRVINDLSPDLYLRPGPRLATGVLELARRLYPPATQRSEN